MMRGTLKSGLIWLSVLFFVFGPLGQSLVWQPESVRAATYPGNVWGISDTDLTGDACHRQLNGTSGGGGLPVQEDWKAIKDGGNVPISGLKLENYNSSIQDLAEKAKDSYNLYLEKLYAMNDAVKKRETPKNRDGMYNDRMDLELDITCLYKMISITQGEVRPDDPHSFPAVPGKENIGIGVFHAEALNYFTDLGWYMYLQDGVAVPRGKPDAYASSLQEFVGYYKQLRERVDKGKDQLFASPATRLANNFFDGIPDIGVATVGLGEGADNPCNKVADSAIGVIGKYMMQGVCNIVYAIHEFLVDTLGSSVNLLAIVSGAGNFKHDAPTKDDIFGTLKKEAVPQELSQPMEVTMEKARSDTSDSSIGLTMRKGYQRVLQFLDSILILIFFLVAIANILQIEINKYSIKKLAPGFLWGFLAAHFSYFIIQALLELSGVLSRFVIGWGGATGSASMFAKAFSFAGETTMVGWGAIFKMGFFNLFILAAIVIVLILAFLFICRVVVFAFAVPLAPLAFFGLFFQPASAIWNRWWKTVSGWIFMPVAVFFCLWLAFMYASVAGSLKDSFITQLINYVIFIFLLWAAVKLPFSMSGEAKMVMDKWSGFGKSMGLRYTPAGAVMRGYNKVSALRKQKEEELTKGDIVKGDLARKFGGNTLNRAVARQEVKQKMRDDKQQALSSQINATADRQVKEGTNKVMIEALKSRGGRYAAIGDKMEGATNWAKRIGGGRLENLRERYSYANLGRETKELQDEAAEIGALSELHMNKSYHEGTMSEDQKAFLSLVDKLNGKMKENDPNSKLSEIESAQYDELARKVFGDKAGGDLIARKNNAQTRHLDVLTDPAALGDSIGIINSLMDLNSVGRLRERKRSQEKITRARRDMVATATGAKAAMEKIQKNAQFNDDREHVFYNGLQFNMRQILGDDDAYTAAEKRASLYNYLQAIRDHDKENNDTRMETFMSNNGITDEVSLANVDIYRAVQRHIATIDADNVEQQVLQDKMNDRRKSSYGEAAKGKQEFFRDSGISIERIGKASKPEEVMDIAKALYGDGATVGQDQGGRLVIDLGAIWGGMNTNSDVFRPSVDAWIGIFDKLVAENTRLIGIGRPDPRLQQLVTDSAAARTALGNLRTAIIGGHRDDITRELRNFKSDDFVRKRGFANFNVSPGQPIDHNPY